MSDMPIGLLQNCRDILTIPEAADILRISPSTMQELVASGIVDHIDICGNTLFLKQFLLDFLETCHPVRYTRNTASENLPVGEREPTHLDNLIKEPASMPVSEGETEMAKSKINQPVMINGERRWITANTMQEFANKVIKLMNAPQEAGKHPFSDYAWNWFHTYSEPTVETATATTYKRQLTLHLIPAFDGLAVEDITTDDVQRLFNGITGAKATKDKVKMVLNQILDAAVDDKLIAQNPLKSKRIRITGKSSTATAPYSVEQMRYLVQHIGDIQSPVDRTYMALQALHPLRLEEVLGLHPSDIDLENMEIHVHRAVTHPTRNQPEVKGTKTDSSTRTIGLSALAVPFLSIVPDGEFLFGGDAPLSYTQVRRMCNRIKNDTGFSENITPIRFRTTVLTDLYDQTKDIKLAQAAAGHTTSAMTLKYYVKGRSSNSEAAAAVDRAYSA